MASRTRPISPHLQVYRPQLTSVLSIAHRGTGIFLAGGMLVLVYWLLALAEGPDAYARARAVLGSGFGQLCLFAWTFALFYHLCNGIRHLVWDAGYGLEIETAEMTGKVVLGASGALTVLAWIIAYGI
jgi:succinate dehydrogenase / fumarate reductase cytochrome b subunit